MSRRLRSVLIQVGSFVLAGGLLYFALRGVDFQEVGRALQTANYLWLVPLAVVAILSHVIRAWRWCILLHELPATHGGSSGHVGLFNAFSALIIGYMANYAAPRVGEVVRSGILARSDRLNMSGVLGTVFIERILDVVVLFIAIGGVSIALLDRFGVIRRLFIDPMTKGFQGIPIGIMAVLALAGVGVMALLYLRWRRQPDYQMLGSGRIGGILRSFANGAASLVRTRRRTAIVVSTLAMWACYGLMAHIPFLILGMSGPFEISLFDSWNIMVIGAIGILIPAPGGTGSYHYITIQALVHLFGVTQAPAATYAVLTHAAQLILYTAMGAILLTMQGVGWKAVRDLSRDEPEEEPDS